jgi:hypothetical protein
MVVPGEIPGSIPGAHGLALAQGLAGAGWTERGENTGGAPVFPGNPLDKLNKDFILKKLAKWGIVQRQDSRLWICLSRFES